jgi:hypothetical protein
VATVCKPTKKNPKDRNNQSNKCRCSKKMQEPWFISIKPLKNLKGNDLYIVLLVITDIQM